MEACKFEHRKSRESEKVTEPEKTEENTTDKLVKIITEIKHSTDRSNLFTMKKNGSTGKEFIVDTGSPVTIIPPEKERDNK